MPNGDTHADEYNAAWCEERHQKIAEEFNSVWAKIRRQDNLMWGTLITLIGNLGGIIATLITLLSSNGGA